MPLVALKRSEMSQALPLSVCYLCGQAAVVPAWLVVLVAALLDQACSSCSTLSGEQVVGDIRGVDVTMSYTF